MKIYRKITILILYKYDKYRNKIDIQQCHQGD